MGIIINKQITVKYGVGSSDVPDEATHVSVLHLPPRGRQPLLVRQMNRWLMIYCPHPE